MRGNCIEFLNSRVWTWENFEEHFGFGICMGKDRRRLQLGTVLILFIMGGNGASLAEEYVLSQYKECSDPLDTIHERGLNACV